MLLKSTTLPSKPLKAAIVTTVENIDRMPHIMLSLLHD